MIPKLKIVGVEWQDEECTVAKLIRRDRWLFWRKYSTLVFKGYDNPFWYYMLDERTIEGIVDKVGTTVHIFLNELRALELDRRKERSDLEYHRSMWHPVKTRLRGLLTRGQDG